MRYEGDDTCFAKGHTMPDLLSGLKAVIIATSHAAMGDTGEPTGLWLEELTSPYYVLADAGMEVDVYSVAGGTVPIDPRSLKRAGENEASVERYLEDEALVLALANTKPADEVELSDYDVVFLPGGHGTMWDYPDSEAIAALVSGGLAQDKIVAAVCHGPAGLVSAKTEDGEPVVKGRRVAGFTNSEEDGVVLTDAVPFLLEDRLKALGATYESGPDFQPFVVVAGTLVTGQNPQSATLAAERIVELLRERQDKTGD